MSMRELSASEVFSSYQRSIGPKTVRQVLMVKGVGMENLKQDAVVKTNLYNAQLRRDKTALNENYTMENLAQDWTQNRLNVKKIKSVSEYMDQGMTHDEAVAEVMGITASVGKLATDQVLGKFGL